MILQMLPLLEQPILQNKFAQSGIMILATIIVATIFTFLLKTVIHFITRNTKTKLDDMLVEKLKTPVWWLILFVGIHLSLLPLQIPTDYDDKAMSSLIIFIITIIIVRTADVLIEFLGKKITAKTESTIDDELLPLFHKFSKVTLYIIGILVILSTAWGIEIAPFLASLGIAGIAIGFALKDTLSNIFGGISLLLDRTFKKGDVIRLDDGTTGVVHEIGLRSTRIKTWDNQLVTIPNGNLSVAKIENWKQPDSSVRITISFGVEYGSKVEKVKETVMSIIKKDKDILKEPAPSVVFTDMADYALQFKAFFFVDDLAKKLETEERVRTHIYNSLNKAKIGIPFPTRTVYIKKR